MLGRNDNTSITTEYIYFLSMYSSMVISDILWNYFYYKIFSDILSVRKVFVRMCTYSMLKLMYKAIIISQNAVFWKL